MRTHVLKKSNYSCNRQIQPEKHLKGINTLLSFVALHEIITGFTESNELVFPYSSLDIFDIGEDKLFVYVVLG